MNNNMSQELLEKEAEWSQELNTKLAEISKPEVDLTGSFRHDVFTDVIRKNSVNRQYILERNEEPDLTGFIPLTKNLVIEKLYEMEATNSNITPTTTNTTLIDLLNGDLDFRNRFATEFDEMVDNFGVIHRNQGVVIELAPEFEVRSTVYMDPDSFAPNYRLSFALQVTFNIL